MGAVEGCAEASSGSATGVGVLSGTEYSTVVAGAGGFASFDTVKGESGATVGWAVG